jgi:hypothetical protein
MGRAQPERGGAATPRHWTWAALMRRAFDLDVLRCPRCAGRMELIATIDDPAVIHRILTHLGLPGARDGPELWQRLLGRPASESGTLRHGDGTHGRSDRCRKSVAAASGAASVRVWHITSRGWDPWTERPLPEVVRVAYPLRNAFQVAVAALLPLW